MNCLIVTGFSGAGKSLVIHALEDIGFYCVDNLPPELIPKFVELANGNDTELQKLAVVCDVRGGTDFEKLFKAFEELKTNNFEYKVVFLEAQPEVLERRFKETRRQHPLSIRDNLSTKAAINKEKELLHPLYGMADYILDTSLLTTAQLRENILSLFLSNAAQSMKLKLLSFGFKYGTPTDADIVLDVRCLSNPFYVAELKQLTGLDAPVVEYIFSSEDAKGLLENIINLLAFSLPLYQKEGKSQLTIAMGCTGGKHRSVAFVEALAEHFKQYYPQVFHRDIGR